MRTDSPRRRPVLLGAIALLLAITGATVPSAALAASPIPCKLDSEGHGCSQGDPWVASLFVLESQSGYVYIYTRPDGKAVTDAAADALAKNLSFRECYPVAHSGPSAKRAICLD